MMDREAIVPVAVGLLIAVLVHLAVAPGVYAWLVDRALDYRLNVVPPTPEEMVEEQLASEPEDPLIGQLDPSTATKVNLIAYEDYRKLRARKSEIDQPAIQQAVEPEPIAQQAPLDPTPPQAISPPMDQPVEVAMSPPMPPQATAAESPVELPDVGLEPAEATIQIPVRSPQPGEDQQNNESPTPPSPASQKPPAEQAQPVEQPNPTVAPKEDFESEPVTEVGYAEVSPGGVSSVQGIKIKTVRPRYSVVAQRTSVPVNPMFMVVFSPEGQVVHVKMLRSSGYDNVDGPIINALYKMTAEGRIGPNGLTIKELHILLGVEEEE